MRAEAAVSRGPRNVSDVGPATLMPQWAARLVGFGALAVVAGLEWQRLLAGVGPGRALVWAMAGTGAGALVVATERVSERRRGLALVAVVAGAVLAGYLVSGADPHYLKPRHWGRLISGVVSGTQSLGIVRLPYDGQDPWPAIALRLLGAELLVLAGLVALWPRARGRGYPFVALAALMVLIASPVVSLGGTRSLALGMTITALTICFLWLERLPLRPGLGVAALLGIALAGAIPIAAVADRGEPWFDYRSFAEGLGPNDPVQFSWAQSYGPMTWPRDGNEVMRVESPVPMYWKARDLDGFDGRAWRVRPDRQTEPAGAEPWQADVPPDWRRFPAWTHTIKLSIRRMRTPDIIGAGTIISVSDNSRNVRPGLASGTWDSVGELRRGDSYTVQTYAPKPAPTQLLQASAGDDGLVDDDLVVDIPLKRWVVPGVGPGPGTRTVRSAAVQFRAWGDNRAPVASFPSVGRADFDVDRIMRHSRYARTWALAQRLRRGAKSPYDYVVRVSRFLGGPDFRYSERPEAPRRGVPPLDAFINDTHEGYCQHYAGAMALLLRFGGVPARVATGFSPGGYSDLHNAWVVRDIDAHAWVEVWFDRYGWTTFDPTPNATPARSQIAALIVPRPAVSSAPSLPATSTDNGKPPKLPATRRSDTLSTTSGQRSAAGGGSPWWLWPLLALGASVAGLAAVCLALFVRARARGDGTIDRAIAELEAALRRVGRPLAPGTTLRQLERRLSGSPEAVAYLRALSAGRYGAMPARPPRAGRRALRRALGEGLGPTGRLRALWALPPWPR